MLRKFVLFSAFIAASLVGGQSYGASYGMAGCGLGSMIIQNNDMMQIFAATTNGSFGSQTFGISSGTSNCVPASKMGALIEQENFVKANLSALSKEMAQGTGSTLSAFANTLGCDAAALAPITNTLQANYATIFQAPGAVAVLERSKTILRNEPAALGNCAHIDI